MSLTRKNGSKPRRRSASDANLHEIAGVVETEWFNFRDTRAGNAIVNIASYFKKPDLGERIKLEKFDKIQIIVDDPELWKEFRQELRQSKVVTGMATDAVLNKFIEEKMGGFESAKTSSAHRKSISARPVVYRKTTRRGSSFSYMESQSKLRSNQNVPRRSSSSFSAVENRGKPGNWLRRSFTPLQKMKPSGDGPSLAEPQNKILVDDEHDHSSSSMHAHESWAEAAAVVAAEWEAEQQSKSSATIALGENRKSNVSVDTDKNPKGWPQPTSSLHRKSTRRGSSFSYMESQSKLRSNREVPRRSSSSFSAVESRAGPGNWLRQSFTPLQKMKPSPSLAEPQNKILVDDDHSSSSLHIHDSWVEAATIVTAELEAEQQSKSSAMIAQGETRKSDVSADTDQNPRGWLMHGRSRRQRQGQQQKVRLSWSNQTNATDSSDNEVRSDRNTSTSRFSLPIFNRDSLKRPFGCEHTESMDLNQGKAMPIGKTDQTSSPASNASALCEVEASAECSESNAKELSSNPRIASSMSLTTKDDLKSSAEALDDSDKSSIDLNRECTQTKHIESELDELETMFQQSSGLIITWNE